MPSRNVLKNQIPDAYYHVYARGINKQKIFLESSDYKYFIHLFERYLSRKVGISKTGEPFPNYVGKIELVAFCLMRNHFHLLVYQNETPYLEKLMRSIMTSYSRYFNLKYKRTGSLFESRYKASMIDSDVYLQHVSRYIHLNPRMWENHRYSSLHFYRDANEPDWLITEKVIDLFYSREEYMKFVADYEKQRDILDDLKHQLADQ